MKDTDLNNAVILSQYMWPHKETSLFNALSAKHKHIFETINLHLATSTNDEGHETMINRQKLIMVSMT